MSENQSGKRKRVLSGVQPSGNLTIGNYVGALRQWAREQYNFESFFCVVDLHAITVPYTPAELRQKTREVAALYLACGIDPEASTVFVQSHVRAHAELTWLLNCITPLGWLNRMTQFKDKSAKQQADSVSTGLLDYPVLMAADILLYQADAVPVGEDQKQHLELTRDIAQRFNHLFSDTFNIPEPMIPPTGARIMGLDNPNAKMSKSETGSEYHAVYLLDPPNRARKKVMRAVTDSGREIRFSSDPERAGVNNLLELYEALTAQSREAIEQRFEGQGYGELKKAVAEAVVETLGPIQQRYEELTRDSSYIDNLLARGAERAAEVANDTLKTVRDRMGFLEPLR
ncbi:MAG TPA: tryptophan--tRNA ligase [Aggregatilinea sp.]|uniref:tryptophan--tRNA ligase n=1 Tax=Aggregatilinea sp. TaxID=2806333 RepID=UPI002C55B646|nr:tryptophan--tRNA ligase [Aggregatilinea sp.]HML20155.1 tryptophan--tRNA ligase [Aggregatilinea sp.]